MFNTPSVAEAQPLAIKQENEWCLQLFAKYKKCQQEQKTILIEKGHVRNKDGVMIPFNRIAPTMGTGSEVYSFVSQDHMWRHEWTLTLSSSKRVAR